MMNRTTILKNIQALPVEEQEELQREMIALFAVVAEPSASINTVRLAGLCNNGKALPSDEEVAQRLDEHRQEKYRV